MKTTENWQINEANDGNQKPLLLVTVNFSYRLKIHRYVNTVPLFFGGPGSRMQVKPNPVVSCYRNLMQLAAIGGSGLLPKLAVNLDSSEKRQFLTKMRITGTPLESDNISEF